MAELEETGIQYGLHSQVQETEWKLKFDIFGDASGMVLGL